MSGKNDFSAVHQILVEYLNECKETEFMTVFQKAKECANDGRVPGSAIYLQIGCEKNLLEIVTCLVKNGVDINETTAENKTPPIRISASKGYDKIFKLLISHPNIKVDRNLLPDILMKLDFQWNSNQSNYYKCFQYFLKYHPQYVNVENDAGNYPLLYGTRHGGDKCVSELLKCKASLAKRNKNGSLTIENIDVKTLKEHFDLCIEDLGGNRFEKKSPSVQFNYANIMPTFEKVEGQEDVEKCLNQRRVVGMGIESEAIYWISQSPDLQELLTHPLITSYMHLKWLQIRWLYFFNAIIYVFFVVAIFFHSYALFREIDFKYHIYVLFVMSLIFLIRELIQLFIHPIKYLTNFENYLEIGLVSIVIYMLVDGIFIDTDVTTKDANHSILLQLSAVAVVLSAFGLEFLIGKHPSFSKHIVMLRTVSKNFFKCILFYLIPIIAFAFSFYILFDNKSFRNPFQSLFKTFLMVTANIDTDEDQFSKYPITSRLIFLFFVITIAVILLNLLNGLAVSDIQTIKTEAAIVDQVCQAEFIAHAESVRFNFLNVMKYLFCKGKTPVHQLFFFNFFAKGICLFPYLEDYCLIADWHGKVKLNNSKHVYLHKKCIKEAIHKIQERKTVNDFSTLRLNFPKS